MASFIQELTRFTLYKPNQGKAARRITLFAALVVIILGGWAFYNWAHFFAVTLQRAGVASVVTAFFCWAAFRVVNYPPFADFLVTVEAEMLKVSWPSWKEVRSSTAVVLVVLTILTAALFVFDIVWQSVFTYVFRIY